MKLAVIHGPGDLRLDEVERQSAGPEDVVMKVVAAGICGTDVAYRQMGYGPIGGPGKPLAIGHEFAGTLVEVGDLVRSFRLGERVAYNSGNSPADIGRGGAEGGFSTHVLLRNIDKHPQSLVRVPDGVTLDHAALVEPLSVAMHGVNRADPSPGQKTAVFGAGPIGLGVIVALRMRGIEDVIAFDLSPLRREQALRMGASQACDPRDKPLVEVLGNAHGVQDLWGQKVVGTEVFIDAAGAPGLIEDIALICPRSSRVVCLAIHKQPISIDGTLLIAKELSLLGSLSYPTEFPAVMDLLDQGKIDAERLISHRFDFSKFLEAFDVAADSTSSTKVLMNFK